MNQQRQTATRPAQQPAPAAQQNTAIAKQSDSPIARVSGTFRDTIAVNNRMEWALTNANLIAPAASVGAMPEGVGIALSVVLVDIENDTYDVGLGKRGLSKSVLQKLAAALGVSWDPRASGRVDDRSDPYYCAWCAVGYYRSFDGQISLLVAEKELDLREGSPTIIAIEQKARAKNKSADGQIREMRQHIQSHAETKAQLRAIRSLGIKTSYTAKELQKPFVAARVMFTGQTDDPELRTKFAMMLAESFLGGNRALYGDTGHGQAHATAPASALHSPPALGTTRDNDDEDDFPASYGESAPAQTRAAAPPPATTWTIPGGKARGTPLHEAEQEDLEYWADRIGKELAGGTARNPDRDTELHAALCAEIARREGVADEDPPASTEPTQTEAKF